MKKIKITSDGTLAGSKITNAHTGEAITNVSEIAIFIDAEEDDGPKAHLVMIEPSLEVIAEVESLEQKWIEVDYMRPIHESIVWALDKGSHVHLSRYEELENAGPRWETIEGRQLFGITHWQLANIPEPMKNGAAPSLNNGPENNAGANNAGEENISPHITAQGNTDTP